MSGICDGRVVVVTGAARAIGLGQAHALAFAAEAGIAAMTNIATKELGRYGVTVNAIAPCSADPDDREPRLRRTSPRPGPGGLRRLRSREHLPVGGVARQLGGVVVTELLEAAAPAETLGA